MKLKGKMVMELTDVNTSEVETIVEENMVTNAVNNILGLNPMAVFYCEEEYSTGLVWTGNLLPICPNMIGGILLFPKALEENADNIYVKSDNLPVAYASNRNDCCHCTDQCQGWGKWIWKQCGRCQYILTVKRSGYRNSGNGKTDGTV